mmetsp:Transcript_16806/g.36884  ORF Transcript_16806/g.36884 Transcript_16806/m.36884 type:complete len:428 (-) Transcript_16806:784-2067(-)
MATSPDKSIIGQVPHRLVAPALLTSQDPAQHGNVLVVPRVAVSNRRAIADASDLVAVVPPCNHTSILGRIILDPLVAREVVVDDHLRAVAHPRLEDELRVGEGFCDPLAFLQVVLHGLPAVLDRGHHDAHSNNTPQWPVQPPDLRCKAIFGVVEVDDLRRTNLRKKMPLKETQDGTHSSGSLWQRLLLYYRWLPADQTDELLLAPIRDVADGEAAKHRDNGPAYDQQPRHLEGEVVGHNGVQHQEELAGRALMPAKEQAGKCEVLRGAKVHVIGLLICRLVLRHRVHQRVPSLDRLKEEAANAGTKGHEDARLHQNEAHDGEHHAYCRKDRDPEDEEASCGHVLGKASAVDVAGLKDLVAEDHQYRRHLFKGPQRGPPNHRNRHRDRGADHVEESVGPVGTGVVLAQANQSRSMESYHVVHKNVATP